MKTRPKARNLILELLLAADANSLSAQQAVLGCGVFGISENSARVALARLSSDALVVSEERGSYALSAQAHQLADDVSKWRSAEQRVRPWTGSYVAVQCSHANRSDRNLLRRRSRSLDMLGFRELERGLYVRPDNIEKDLRTIEKRMRKLGLDDQSRVFLASNFSSNSESEIRRLWDCKALNASYRKRRTNLEQWLTAQPRLKPEIAVRDAFLMGGDAIRQVIYDPLLPEPFVDAAARHAFFAMARRFDAKGKVLWRVFYESSTGLQNPFTATSQIFRQPSLTARA